jgi:integrase
VAGCRFSQHRDRLCYRHSYAWRRQGRPGIEGWLAAAAPLGQAAPAAACAVEWCGLDAELAPPPLCRSHRARWRIHGRPSLEQFLFDCTHYGRPRFDLRGLKPQLRLEIQYALQCRADERRTRTTPRSIHPLLRYLAQTNATSLLDHSAEYWIAATRLGGTSTVRAFVRFAVECVLDARDGTGWDSEYEADVWRLARLGLSVSRRARLEFRPITPTWLRQLAKRWMRWRISCGLALGQIRKDMVSLTRLARHTPALARSAGSQRLDRTAIEQYLAALAIAVPHPKTRSGDISVIAALLRATHQHRWAPGLPADALIHASDHPRHETTPTPRALPEFVMAQLENPANLAKLTDPRARLLVEVLIGTGLRFGDASRLRVDCLVRDRQGAPYLRYRNHKMRREAMVPIDDTLAAAVQARQQQVRGQHPGATALFPRQSGNPDQRLPIPAATFNVHLQQWLADCHVVDESGVPVKVTAHQFRHTYATRLINSEVSQEVVRRLLDHTSHTMTSHYARLADATIREQWQRAQKVNIRGEPVDLERSRSCRQWP